MRLRSDEELHRRGGSLREWRVRRRHVRDRAAAFDLPSLLDPKGALPGNYGTDLPAGHDGYLIWENTSYDLKFRVYATVDFEVVA